MYIKLIFIFTFSSYLLACAAPAAVPEETPEAVESTGSDCIYEGTIRDYTVLDDANLIVTASAKRKYHIQLSRRAFGLRSTWHIGFTSPTSRICAGFSEVIVDDNMGPAGAGFDKYRIHSITRLAPADVDALLIRFGRKEPEIEQAPATEPVESAEVEELD